MRHHAARARAAVLSVAALTAIVTPGCAEDSPRTGPAAAQPPRSGDITAERLAQAIRTNPNMPAEASCDQATAADRRAAARTFGKARRLFVCRITLARQAPAIFDVQLLASGCFVAERRRRGQADYGCVRKPA
jgi:hypothetical protein